MKSVIPIPEKSSVRKSEGLVSIIMPYFLGIFVGFNSHPVTTDKFFRGFSVLESRPRNSLPINKRKVDKAQL
jgi:hypothetical protein